jgi:hypothetical protein
VPRHGEELAAALEAAQRVEGRSWRCRPQLRREEQAALAATVLGG